MTNEIFKELCSSLNDRPGSAIYLEENSLVKWNDRPERTKEEVLELFDTTIERLSR